MINSAKFHASNMVSRYCPAATADHHFTRDGLSALISAIAEESFNEGYLNGQYDGRREYNQDKKTLIARKRNNGPQRNSRKT